MKQIKEVKSDQKSLEDQTMENTNYLEVMDQNSRATDKNLDNLTNTSLNTKEEMSNLTAKVSKISSNIAKREEACANVLTMGAAIETELAKSSDWNIDRDVKIERLINKINDLEEKISNEKKMDEKIEHLEDLIKNKI